MKSKQFTLVTAADVVLLPVTARHHLQSFPIDNVRKSELDRQKWGFMSHSSQRDIFFPPKVAMVDIVNIIIIYCSLNQSLCYTPSVRLSVSLYTLSLSLSHTHILSFTHTHSISLSLPAHLFLLS